MHSSTKVGRKGMVKVVVSLAEREDRREQRVARGLLRVVALLTECMRERVDQKRALDVASAHCRGCWKQRRTWCTNVKRIRDA